MRTPIRRAAACSVLATALVALTGPGRSDAHWSTPGGNSCCRCHDFDPMLSHPVDVYPSMTVPPHLPLTGGRMTCETCHPGTGPADVRGHRDHGSVPAGDLCVECHRPDRTRGRGLHTLAGRAHMSGGGPTATTGPGGDRIDAESAACLACHDGAVARNAPTRTGPPGPPSFARLMGGNHPIGVRQGPRGGGDTLRHPQEVDAVVRLFDGNVGCGSCHSPYAAHEDQLVMSNRGSALCLACHDF